MYNNYNIPCPEVYGCQKKRVVVVWICVEKYVLRLW